MKIFKIKKKSGGYRTIYVPDSSRKKYLSSLLPELNKLQTAFLRRNEFDMMAPWGSIMTGNRFVLGVNHGFLPGHSPVTNAIVHLDYEITVCFDISNCFDSTTFEAVKAACGDNNPMARFVDRYSWALFEQGAARQGLPTSPALANVALSLVDVNIVNALRKIWHESLPGNYYFHRDQNRGIWFDFHDFINVRASFRTIPYIRRYYLAFTRYADDMTISINNIELLKPIISVITTGFDGLAFDINPKKTRVQHSKFGNRVITGISVGKEISPTRRTRRKLRAALHQSNNEAAHGLAEWCKLKEPC